MMLSTRFLLSSILWGCFLWLLVTVSACQSPAEKIEPLLFDAKKPFFFFLLGDTPYSQREKERFPELIQWMNTQKPGFTVHVGDIKSGTSSCSDKSLTKVLKWFHLLEHPVVYTPGDNEWTDCDRWVCGSYNPNDRLQILREMFFAPESNIVRNLPVVQQSSDPNFYTFSENQRWVAGDVVFTTLHMVGSNNNYAPQDKNRMNEFLEREKANKAWLKAAFDEARKPKYRGLVLMYHAEMHLGDATTPDTQGFDGYKHQLQTELATFSKPVLILQGDSHVFRVDHPKILPDDPKAFPNLTRVVSHSDTASKLVKITVNPGKTPELFQVETIPALPEFEVEAPNPLP